MLLVCIARAFIVTLWMLKARLGLVRTGPGRGASAMEYGNGNTTNMAAAFYSAERTPREGKEKYSARCRGFCNDSRDDCQLCIISSA